MIDSEGDMAEVLGKCFCAAGRMQVDVLVLGGDAVCLCPRDGCTTSDKHECGLEASGLWCRAWEKLLGGTGRLLVQKGAAQFLCAIPWRTLTVNFIESLPGFFSCPFPRLSILWAFSLLLQRSC